MLLGLVEPTNRWRRGHFADEADSCIPQCWGHVAISRFLSLVFVSMHSQRLEVFWRDGKRQACDAARTGSMPGRAVHFFLGSRHSRAEAPRRAAPCVAVLASEAPMQIDDRR